MFVVLVLNLVSHNVSKSTVFNLVLTIVVKFVAKLELSFNAVASSSSVSRVPGAPLIKFDICVSV